MTEATEPIRILLVEDNPGDAVLLRETLREAGPSLPFELVHVMRLDDAQRRLSEARFDIILLDLSLPDAFGLETLSRARASASGTPIVVLTGTNDEAMAVRAVQEGAQDYLVKGNVDCHLLSRAIRYAIERHRMVAELERATRVQQNLASHDSLTGLPNRKLFYERLEAAIQQARADERPVSIVFLDLDDFKLLNDSLGHDVGDKLLKAIAWRVTGCVRANDTAARLGGDEFTFVLYDADRDEAARIAHRILDSIAEPIEIDGHELHVTGSAGISSFPADGPDIETMLRNADMAMYKAKAAGANSLQFYLPSMSHAALQRMDMERELRLALERGQIIPFYQPKMNMRTGVITGMEALARWRKPGGAMVGPDSFIPLAEETGLIVQLGEQVLRQACQQSRVWRESGLPPMRMAVNLSTRQLQQRPTGRHQRYDPISLVSVALAEAGLPAEALELEVTESLFLKDPEFAMDVLGRLREMGVMIAIDDFGTGYSSLSYLKMLPARRLKIDRSFVRNLQHSERDTAIARAIIGMAHSLEMTVVAEGVETVEQFKSLRKLGCDEMQGYLFSPPMNAADATAFIANYRQKSA